MNEWNSTPQFEEHIKLSFRVPKIRQEFVRHLDKELIQFTNQNKKKKRRLWGMRPAWAIGLIIVLSLFISTLIIGPQRVYAEVAKLLGYIPGVGLVDKNSPIRVLAEPVRMTRDGITVSVTSAILTNEKTLINFGVVSGVPRSAYPKDENGTGGCMELAYLLLPDGMKINAANEMGPLPANVNEMTLVMPCIFNTLPGTVPTDWEFPIRFIPAPPDMTIVPVIEILITPSPTPRKNIPPAGENPLAITKVLDIGDQFVIMGEFRYSVLGDLAHDNVFNDGSIWVVNEIKIVDGNGQNPLISSANEIDLPAPSQPDAETWNFKVDKNFVAPLTLTYVAEHISPISAPEQAKFEFDVGPNPQNRDEWPVNKDFNLGGYNIHLDSITYSTNFGYEFQFTADHGASTNWIGVNIEGYTPNCGGGGGGDYFPDTFVERFCVTNNGSVRFPTGKLTGILSFQPVTRTYKNFEIQWSPNSTQVKPEISSTP